MNKIIVACLSCAILIGCSAKTGNTNLSDKKAEDLERVLIKGKTTREEVKKLFGDPDDSDIMHNGKMKWTFTHICRSDMVRNYIPIVNWFSHGTDDTKRKLVTVFNGDVLEEYSFSTSTGETNAGLV